MIENRSRDYVEARIRAGVLEQASVDVLVDSGVGERLQREGLRHDGIYLQWPDHREHLDFPDLWDARSGSTAKRRLSRTS